MSGVVVTWDGTGHAKRLIARAAADALEEVADVVLEDAQADTPVAEVGGGYLRDTGEVDVDRDACRATVSFGSPPIASDGRHATGESVAAMVHEIKKYRHGTGHAKFLERAFKKSAPHFAPFIAAAIRRRVP
jgi:hypothetical protein